MTTPYVLRETAHNFGEGQRLYGVLTHPATPDPSLPVVVIPNTGLDHRVGPNRVHVQTARALAAAGLTVFRFDISGLGDSDAPHGQTASSVEDFQRALDFLDTRGLSGRYAAVGLCSGAHDAHQTSRIDERVVGLFSIDGYAYTNERFHRLRWRMRLSHPWRSLQNIIGRRFPRFRLIEPQGAGARVIAWPDREVVAADYRTFQARGVQLAFVFTGDLQSVYLYADQHHDVFPDLRESAPVWFLPNLDHLLSRREGRREVIDHLRTWLLSLRQTV